MVCVLAYGLKSLRRAGRKSLFDHAVDKVVQISDLIALGADVVVFHDITLLAD